MILNKFKFALIKALKIVLKFFNGLIILVGLSVTYLEVSQSETMVTPSPTNNEDVIIEEKQKKALQLYKQNKYDEIVKLLKSDADLLDRSGLAVLAKSFSKIKDYENEKLIYERLIALNPSDKEAFVALGHLYINLKKYDEAILNYRQSLNLKSKFKPALDGLFKVYKLRNLPNERYELRIIIQDLIAISGDKIEYISELCRINTLDGFHDVALKSCNQAIAKDPKIPDNYLFKAYIDTTLGNNKNVVKTLSETVKKFPNTDYVLLSYGIVLMQQKSFGSAEKYFTKAVQINPNSFENQIGLALTSYENKNYETSIIAFKKSCDLEPYKSVRELKRVVNALKYSANEAWRNKFDLILDGCTPANFKKLSPEARAELMNKIKLYTPFAVPLTMDPKGIIAEEDKKKPKPGESIFKSKEEGEVEDENSPRSTGQPNSTTLQPQQKD